MPTKLVYFCWFPAEAAVDGWWRSLTIAEKGLHLELLSIAWVEGGLEKDLDVLARSVGLTRKEFNKLWVRVSRKWLWNGSFIVNHRQEKERIKATEKSGQAKRAVASRENRRSSGDVSDDPVPIIGRSSGDHPRASDSEYVFNSSSDSSFPERRNPVKPVELPEQSGFHSWWAVWKEKRGGAYLDEAVRAYLSVIQPGDEEKLMISTRSYLSSRDGPEGFRPDKFLFQVARDKFPRWPEKKVELSEAEHIRRRQEARRKANGHAQAC